MVAGYSRGVALGWWAARFRVSKHRLLRDPLVECEPQLGQGRTVGIYALDFVDNCAQSVNQHGSVKGRHCCSRVQLFCHVS